MNQVAHLFTIVQIDSVRRFGYALVSVLKRDGSRAKRAAPLVVRFPEEVRELAVKGSVWRVAGDERVASFTIGTYTRYETVIDAKVAEFVRPSGLLLARWINANVQGIGPVIANRLLRQRKLEKWVTEGDVKSLLTVAGMTEERVDRLIECWPQPGLFETIEWLQKLNLPAGLAEKLIRIFGEKTIQTLEDNPFLLLSVGIGFERVMKLAEHLGILRNDERVLGGAAVHVGVSYSNRTGSTVIEPDRLKTEVEKLVGFTTKIHPGDLAIQQGFMAKTPDGYQVWGTGLMEASVAKFIADALHRGPGQGSFQAAWERTVTLEAASKALCEYEGTLPFKLTEEQKRAVIGAVCAPVAGISGGAGTGKTTILRAIIGVYKRLSSGLAYYPIALSGRAAQRMTKSIKTPAQTIAKLTYDHLGPGRPDLPNHVLIIIDEASMVDLLSFYRLIGLLPVATRILFVGDTGQLPPVGPGLIFHSLVSSGVPFFELSQVKRQSEDSGIHAFASAAREFRCKMPATAKPTLAASADCCFMNTPPLAQLTEFWKQAGGISSSIILTPVRKGAWGVDVLNQHFQTVSGNGRLAVHYADAERGWIPWITASQNKLRVGDPVLVTRNLYDERTDVRNGDLGVITKVYDALGSDDSLGVVLVNDVELPLTFELLCCLELGYAITIHKAQGSQWPTVFAVVPEYADQMLDATLIYTAATRPTERLILVGNPVTLAKGIRRGNSATKRLVGVEHRIRYATQLAQRSI
ncbi:ATPase AAA [Geomonas limicola]|uniref:ATPase AAA n=1 Tax=Geomonas limicola TaxID=2740186 RepID=A0A6V8N7I4_9BACT|nr:AAA family ATPase [Geomonas limicola]GFO67503.1 ATPase AAA [Geomonas limicola]